MRASDINNSYEVLRESLLYVAQSERNQVHLIDRWFSRALEHEGREQMRSFVRELFPILSTAIRSLDPTGCSPTFFSSFRETVQKIEKVFPDMFDRAEYASCKAALHKCENTVLVWLGSPLNYALPEESSPADTAFGSAERRTLDRFIETLLKEGRREAEFYLTVAKEWDTRTQTEFDCARIPLLEMDLSGGIIENFRTFGRIVNLRVTLHGNGKENGRDVLSFPQLIDHAASAGVEEELLNAAQAVREVAREFLHQNSNGYVHCSVSFDEARMHTSGRSLGLGFSAALLAAQSRTAIGKQYSFVAGDAVLTGMVDPSGLVRPLDGEHIREKVATLFFSPYKRLVLPKENETVAEEARGALAEKYPTRRLDILPIRHLWDSVQHRQVIEVRQYSMKQRITRRIKHHQTQIAVGSLALVVVMVVGYLLLIKDWDRNPYQITLYGNDYQIRNKNGGVLWTQPYQPPERPRREREEVLSTFSEPYAKQYVITDLDGDGLNEVILGRTNSKVGFSDSVYCFNADGTIRWSTPVGKPVVTTENRYTTQPYGVHRILAGEIDSTGKKRIAIIANMDFYPCFVYLLDVNGNILGEYLHLGSLSDMCFVNGVGKSKKNIVATGTHNGFHSGVVIMFDPDFISGACPQEESRRLVEPQLSGGTEMMYLKLPKSYVYHFYRGKERNPIAHILTNSDSTFQVNLYEATIQSAYQPDRLEGIPLRYDIDFNMRVRVVASSTQYDTLYQHGYKSGLIPEPLTTDYFDHLISNVEYWDGEKFVKTPTMNRIYTKAKERNKPH